MILIFNPFEKIATIIAYYIELLGGRPVKKQTVLHVSGVDGTSSKLDWNVLKDSSQTNCDCIAICQSHDQIVWVDSIGYSGLVDESYVHSCKRFTDLNSIDWIKLVSTGPERNHFIIKSGEQLYYRDQQGNQQLIDIGASRVSQVHCFNTMILLQLIDSQFIYFYHSQIVAKNSRIELFKLSDKIATIMGQNQVKDIILYHDEHSDWADLKLGFGAILSTSGQLIEFTHLFGNTVKHVVLLTGIEHIYSDPKSRQYYFIQSFGGLLYTIETSVDLIDRIQSLKQVEIKHMKSDNDQANLPMSNKYVKKLVFGPADTADRRVTILTREDKLIRCSVDSNGTELAYPYYINLDVPDEENFQLVHCSTGSYYISTSATVITDCSEQVSLLSRIIHLSAPFHRDDYALEAAHLDQCVFACLKSLQFSLTDARTSDLVSLMDSVWQLECEGNLELLDAMLSLWLELINRDSIKLMAKLVAQIRSIPSVDEEVFPSSQYFKENLLIQACVNLLAQLKYNEPRISHDSLNIIWLFMLQFLQRYPLQNKTNDLTELSVVSSSLIISMAQILDAITTCDRSIDGLFQVVTDSFCHYADIIEAAVYQAKTLKTLPFFVMSNRICEIFINLPVQNDPFETRQKEAPIITFFTKVVKFLKQAMMVDLCKSDMLNVLFNELMESIQKMFSTIALLEQTQRNYNTRHEYYNLTKEHLLPPNRPQLVLECEVETAKHALRIGDFVIDLNNINEAKRQSLHDQYHQSPGSYVSDEDRELLAEQKTFVLLPDSLRQHVNSVGTIVAMINQAESNVNRTAEIISLFCGTMRLVVEESFEGLLPPMYSFAMHLSPNNEVNKPDNQLVKRLLAPYATHGRPMLILLEKCIESFFNLNDSDAIRGYDTLRQNVAKIFMAMMKRHQSCECTDLVTLCLSPLRKAEFLCRHSIVANRKSRWILNESSNLRTVVNKRIMKKQLVKWNNEIVAYILDDANTIQVIESYLNKREIFVNLMYRCARLPAHFRQLPTKTKVAYMHGWLSKHTTTAKTALYQASFFVEMKNQRIREIEIFADVLCNCIESVNFKPWSDIDIEVISLITFLTTAINRNMTMFKLDSLPYYIINTLQRLILNATKYVYFDPVLYYVQSNALMQKPFGVDLTTSSFESYTLGCRVIRRHLLQQSAPLFRENNSIGTIVARDEDDDDGVVVTVRWEDPELNRDQTESYHNVNELVILDDNEPVEIMRGGGGGESVKTDFGSFEQNPLQIFLIYMVKLLAQQKQHTSQHALVPIVLHAASNDFNFSTLNLIKNAEVANNVFTDIFSRIKNRVLSRSSTNCDVFTNIQWLRFLSTTTIKEHILEIINLLGKLVVLFVKSQVDHDKTRALLALTYALNIRFSCRHHSYQASLSSLVDQIVNAKLQKLNEQHLGALFAIGSINLDRQYIVGTVDDNGNEIIVKGPNSALSLQIKSNSIELVTTPNAKQTDDSEFQISSSKLIRSCVRLTMVEIGDTNVVLSGGPLQLKKSDKKLVIDQFAKYMVIRTKFILCQNDRIVRQCATVLESKSENDVELFINRAMKSQTIRHTIDRTELLNQWKSQILSGKGKIHDNNISSFSASLFATNLQSGPLERNPEKKRRKKRTKTKLCPDALVQQMSEMGFPGKLVRRAFTALIQEGADRDEINSNMLVSRILDLQQGHELLFFEDDLSSDQSSESESIESSDNELDVPDRVRPRSDFGDLPFEYEGYVRENVRPGSCVILLKQQQQINARSIGKVRDVNRSNALRSESIQVEFYRNVENSATFYPSLIWVKPCDLELVDHGLSPIEEKHESSAKVAIGQAVNVRSCVPVPIYGWGGISHDSQGTVRDIIDSDIIVDFPTHAGWRGRVDQMEPSVTSKRIVTDAERIIIDKVASSNTDIIHLLFDGNCDTNGTYWRSSRIDQSDDDIWIEFKIKPNCIIHHIKMRVDYRDQSFMPTNVGVYLRENATAKSIKAKEINVRETTTLNKAIQLLGKQDKYYSVVRLQINTMLQGGNDCKIRALEISASQPPLKLRSPLQWPSTYTYDMSEKCNVYVWGLNDSDQILKRHGRIFDPLLSKQLTALRPKSVSMSSKGTLILTQSGDVYVIGDLAPKPASASGAELRQACRENGETSLGMVEVSAHCTGKHWLGLDRFGSVWICESNCSSVRKVMDNVVAISAGFEYSLVVDKSGQVYGWGSNRNGRILPTEEAAYQKPIHIPIDVEICSVTAGSLSGASLGLDRYGNVYGWGGSKDFQLATQNDEISEPIKLTISDYPVKQLASGAEFTAALNEKGQIITWGRCQAGRLGHSQHQGTPRQIETESSVSFNQVVCGALHCMAIDSNGSLWTWGDNSHGQLGQEQTMIKSPQIIIKGLTNIAGIASGSGHASYWEHCFVKSKGSPIHVHTGDTTVFGSLDTSLSRLDLLNSVKSGLTEPLDHTLPLKEHDVEVSFNHFFSSRVIIQFITEHITKPKYFNVGWDLAKMMLFKRLPLNNNLFARLWMILDKCPNQLWSKLLTDCKSIASGYIPISKSTAPYAIVSSHPYKNNQKVEHFWRNPGASSVQMTFDLNCHIEQNHDYLQVSNFNRPLMHLTGKFGPRQSIEMPLNYLHFMFESDSKVCFWGYEISLRPQYNLDLGVRLSDDEIHNLPFLTFYRYMMSDKMINSMSKAFSQQLAKYVLQCLMRSSIMSRADSMWLFDLALKLLKRHYVHVDGFEQKVKHLLSELIHFETDDVSAERKLQFSDTIRLLWRLVHVFDRPPSWTVFSSVNNLNVESFDVFSLFDILDGKMPSQFTKRVHDRVKRVYNIDIEDPISIGAESLTNEQISQWSADDPAKWWQVNQPCWKTQVFMFGFNNRGQLGSTSGVFSEESLNEVTFSDLTELNPSQIVLGQQSLFAIMNNGDVWSSGESANGRLGYPPPETTDEVKLRKIENLSSVKSLSTHPNGKHVLALSCTGVVLSWGDSEFGQTGHGSRDTVEKPRLIQSLRGVEIVKISAGSRHSACIDSRGNLYTWGCGRHGKLGHPIASGTNHADVTRPKKVFHFEHLFVVDVACGDSDGHTVALTDGQSGRNVWSWGRQGAVLGRHCPTEFPAHLPGLIPFHCDVQIKSVYAGYNFSVALSEMGEVFTWGKGGLYRLGHGDEENAFAPLKVNVFDEKVKQVAVGALHTICVTESNTIIGWGDNERGQLAQDNTIVKQPQQIHQFDTDKSVCIAAGSAHTALVEMELIKSHEWPIPEPIPIKYTTLENISHKDICVRRQMLLELSNQIVKFYQLLDMRQLFHLSGLIIFQVKENLLRRLLTSTMWTDVKHGPTIQINRVVKEPTDPTSPDWMGSVTWQVIHEILFDDSNIQAFKLNGRCWKIRFIGESVDDCGGGYSDSIAEICQEMQCPKMALPLLVCTPNTAEHEETSREFVLKPVTDETTQCERQLYVFLGLLIGSAIRQGSPLSLRMDKSMWKLLRGESLTLSDLFAMDQSFKQKIEFVKNNLEEIDVDGTIRRVSGEIVTVVDGNVTVANKDEYLSKAIEFKLNEFNSAILIVRENIIKVIQLPLLAIFTPDELNTLITGEVDIPIDLLKKVTVYKGITADSDYAAWFWEILQDFTCKERQVSWYKNNL